MYPLLHTVTHTFFNLLLYLRLYQISVFEHNQQQVPYSWLFTDSEIEAGICINKTS